MLAAIAATWASVWVRAFLAYGISRSIDQKTALCQFADWLLLPLTGYPDFATWQPFLDEIITHPGDDAFRARHNFRRTIETGSTPWVRP